MMSDIYIHNTLTNQRELFIAQDERRITMYVCGPTVYGPAHVGNARPAVVFDLFFRLLREKYGAEAVIYARNITDIDDKIISAAAKNNETPDALTKRWREVYGNEMAALHVLSPTVEPSATAYIDKMQAMIKTLIDKGNAYEAHGHVLFDVGSYSDYGQLSNRRLEDMIAGARVEVAPYKKNAADFVLWKPSSDEQPGWGSPWGRGRPGWHIECSTMAAACLGEQIDLHGGGQDLIFPHHENEVAQSCCAHGKNFSRYWMHNGHVNMDGDKMSKSLGNVLSLGDSLKQFSGEVIRYALLSAHYRSPLNWTKRLLEEAKSALDRLYRALASDAAVDELAGVDNTDIYRALCDDLNTPQALSIMHDLAHKVNRAGDIKLRAQLLAAGRFMGFFNVSAQEWAHSGAAGALSDEMIDELINARNLARKNRDFVLADSTRDKLAKAGVVLEDTPTGTTWRRG